MCLDDDYAGFLSLLFQFALWVTLYLGIVPEILPCAEQRPRAGQSGNQLFKDRF